MASVVDAKDEKANETRNIPDVSVVNDVGTIQWNLLNRIRMY